MVTSLVEPKETVQIPAPFILDEERWFPLRAIAEALGAEVTYRPANSDDAEFVAFAVEIESDEFEAITLHYEENAVVASISQGALERQLPVLVQKGRVFIIGRFFEQFLQLKYTCYTSVVVFEINK